MRVFTSVLTLALVASVAFAAFADDERPNILLVLSDDHSAPHLGCYGNPDIRTPNFDRFAEQGIRFNRAYVTSPQCVPSRAGIMACRSPVGIGMSRFTAPFPHDVVVFPDLLKQAGYFTGLAGRTYHLEGSSAPEMRAAFQKHNLRGFGKRFDYAKTAGSGRDAVSQFREFLAAVPQDRPFFLQLCFHDPHRPLDENAIDEPHDPQKLTLPKHFPDTPAVRVDFARYYDEIARLDKYFGEVIKELDDRKLAEKTIVVFMGDNGASTWRGKGTLHEFGVHVPLLVRWTGKVQPGVSDALISSEDLGPTFLAAANLEPAKGMTGQSFLKLLLGQPYKERKFVFAARTPHGSGLPVNSAFFDLGRCVVSPTHKFIYNATNYFPYSPVDFGGSAMAKEVRELAIEGKLPKEIAAYYRGDPRPMFELYDLENDPAELNNLAGKPEVAEVEKELRAALIEWMILERDYLPIPITERRQRPRPPVPDMGE